MALPCPGPAPISLLDIQNEFGGTYLDGTFTQIKEYYRGGGYVANTDQNANIPTSGQISFNQFFCSSGEIIIVIGSGTNINVRSLFGTWWNSLRPKRLIVSSGAVIGPPAGGTHIPSNQAMLVDGNYTGALTIENRGSIQGGGGRRGGDPILSFESRTDQNSGGNGGAVPLRFYAPTTTGASVKLQNKNGASIFAGGGGGGRGGLNSQSYTQIGDNTGSDNVVNRSGEYYYTIEVTPGGGYGGLGQGYLQQNTSGTTEIATSATAQFNAIVSGNIVAKLTNGSSMRVNRSGGGNLTYNLSPGSSSRYNASGAGGNTNITAYVSSGATARFNYSGSSGSGTINLYVSRGGTVSVNRSGAGGLISIYGTGGSGVTVNQSPASSPVVRYNDGVNYDQNEPNFVAIYDGIVNFTTNPDPTAVKGGDGGDFGNPGSSGQNGTYANGSPGGSAGDAISGITYVTLENSGDIIGAQL